MNPLKQIVLLGILTAFFSLLAGLGIKAMVPFMSAEIDDFTLLVVSWLSVLLFVPGYTGYCLFGKVWMPVVIEGMVGFITGLISGYFWDSLFSCLLIGVLSSSVLWGSGKVYKGLLPRLYVSVVIIAVLISVINAWGHGLNGHTPLFFFSLAAGTLFMFLLLAFGAKWIASQLAQF